MILKILMAITAALFIVFSFIYVYSNLPINPSKLIVEKQNNSHDEIISYGTTEMFAENMRFGHNNISYFVEGFCSPSHVARIENAFEILSDKVGIISFYEIYDSKEADIFVSCSEKEVSVGKNLFAIGEGGPTRFMKVGKFHIIEKGKIHLYKESKCDYPVVELHELLHVFGFNHSENSKSIMYPIYNCDQRITSDIIMILKGLYSLKPLPDAAISELEVVKKGRYLDFEITISNEGLSDIKEIEIFILSSGREISRFKLEEIKRGYARTLRVTNLKMFSSNINAIDFYIDYENNVPELDKTNNHAQVVSQSH